MNKLFIGLLIVATGAGVFFLLSKKKNTTEIAGINKELIIGKWKTDAVIANDSGFNKYNYNFQKEGTVLRSLNDSVKADTTHYEWNKVNDLIWYQRTPSEKETPVDSSAKIYSVVKLTQDSLLVQSADSSTVLFTKVK
jgi:hypothetical protein